MMNKIIIVGHPQANIKNVEQLLVASGMAPAKTSRRDGLSPQDIGATLLKAHGVLPVEQRGGAEQVQQINVAPVWQGMILDLMLGNLEQPLWGWSDTQAIHLLDYWREQDPATAFVLVYDEPHTALTRLCLKEAAASQEEIQRRLDCWTAYNSALLHFHLRNPKRSVLVHAQQIKPSAERYLQHLSERIATPLQLEGLKISDISYEQTALEDDTVSTVMSDAQIEVLIDLLLKTDPKVTTLYAEMQAAATLPSNAKGELAFDRKNAYYQAWQACLMQQQYANDLNVRIQELSSEVMQQKQLHAQSMLLVERAAHTKLEAQTKKLSSTQSEVESLTQEKEILLSKLHEAKEELNLAALNKEGLNQELLTEKKIRQSYEQEVSLLASQLHIAQEELSRIQQINNEYIQNLSLVEAQKQKAEKEKESMLAELHQASENLSIYYTKHEKSIQLLNIVESQKQEAIAEKNLLVSQLHEAQEELQQLIIRYDEQASEINLLKENILKKDSRLNFFENKIKSIEKKALLELTKSADDLTALKNSEKKQIALAQKIRLEAEGLRKENSFLVKQLHQAQEEAQTHYLENKKLKAKLKPRIYYGAADRIKRQLSYRLGACMIEKSNSLGGWFSMPFALRKEIKKFYKDKATQKNEKLPPIFKYQDAHEAERVKKHLSYRLGSRMITNSRSLKGWLTMPWALYGEVKDFQKTRN